jgi:hypothetical protein
MMNSDQNENPLAGLSVRAGRCLGSLAPHDDDSSILFDGPHIRLQGKIVYFPVPPDLLASLQPAAAFGEPELGRDRGIDERFKYFGNRFANEHFGFCDWLKWWHQHSEGDRC